MNEKIGVGVIGANPDRGWAKWAHIPAIKSLPQYELRAVATSRRETANAAGKEFGVSLAFDNAAELIAHPDVNLVVVSVKVPAHREIVLAALQAGKHVYCEWPLGNGLAEAVEMADLARRQNVRTAIGLQGRAAPAINRVRALVAEGYVGRVLGTSLMASGEVFSDSIESANAYLFDKSNGANLLTIMFGHLADTLCYCLGEWSELSATQATLRREISVIETRDIVLATSPDQLAVSGILKGGALASVYLRGGHSRGTNLLWEINGTDGDLVITADQGYIHNVDLKIEGGRDKSETDKSETLEPLSIPDEYRWVPTATPPGSPFHVAQVYAQLARDINEGTRLCANFDDAVLRHRMVEAVQKSAESGTRQSYSE